MYVHRSALPEVLDFYASLEADVPGENIIAALGLVDRYFLMVDLLGRYPDMVAKRSTKAMDWLYARVREVEAEPDSHLDLWSRDHYKSSVVTFGGTIQDNLRDPEECCGIFSHTRGIAKGFLRQVKLEYEQNDRLKLIYADVLWRNPQVEAPKWSEDDGIVLKRTSNPKEATLEAWGLVDGQPTSKHFGKRLYDDVVTRESVTTSEQISKTTTAWELSNNLGTSGGREQYVGTRYSFGDSYAVMMDRKAVKARIHPATDDGTLDGDPVFLSKEEWEDKKRKQPTTIAAQMLLNPAAGEDIVFRLEKIQTFVVRPRTLNVYILGDPSAGKKDNADNTALIAIGYDAQLNMWLLDGYAHRMALQDRWRNLETLHWTWKQKRGVQSVQVFYEEYGLQADIEHFEYQMQRIPMERRFVINPVNWTHDGGEAKNDRIKRLVPDVKSGRFRVPALVWHETEGEAYWRAQGQQLLHQKMMQEPEAWAEARARGDEDLIMRPIKRVVGVDIDRISERQPGAASRREGYGSMKIYDLTRHLLGEMQYFPANKGKRDAMDATSRFYDAKPTAPIVLRPEAMTPSVHIDT